MALTELRRFDSRIEAEIVRGKLQAGGVHAILFDDGLSSLGIGSLTPVRLMVDEAEREEAEALLES